MNRELFTRRSLEGLVRVGDRRQYGFKEQQYAEVLEAASAAMLSGTLDLSVFGTALIRGKVCVAYPNYDVHLLFRSIARHLRRRMRIASPSRDDLIRGLIEALLDATPMHVVRRDIRSFYESVPTGELRRRLSGDTTIPPIVRSYLDKFLETHTPADNMGIPRGTALSAVLADLVMREFDANIRELPGVFRYYRFADDIIALTTGDPAELSREMERALPVPMVFNRSKAVDLALVGKRAGTAAVDFEYLGYRFTTAPTHDKRTSRMVRVSFSERKLNRLRGRLILAFKEHARYPDSGLLFDRLRYLSSNQRIMRGKLSSAKDSPYIYTGLFYNYPACGTYVFSDGRFDFTAYDRVELKALDGFYHALLHRAQNTTTHHANLKRISFNRSYEMKIHHDFDPARAAEIKRCWRHI